jgi:hypothetical protein
MRNRCWRRADFSAFTFNRANPTGSSFGSIRASRAWSAVPASQSSQKAVILWRSAGGIPEACSRELIDERPGYTSALRGQERPGLEIRRSNSRSPAPPPQLIYPMDLGIQTRSNTNTLSLLFPIPIMGCTISIQATALEPRRQGLPVATTAAQGQSRACGRRSCLKPL